MHAIIEPITQRADARGSLCEPLDDALLTGQRNVHVVLTVPGGIRGNHRHERTTEVAAVWGPALVRLRDAGGVRDTHVPAGEVYRFTMPAGVAHAFQNTGDAPMLLVAFASEVHDPGAPDLIRDVLIEG